MDVVYNHVSEFDRNPLKYAGKSAYFRLDANGDYVSRSGCGNDFATENPMARRLILDSVRYWMREYHVDGFRFDLATLIDRDTLRTIVEEARAINPNVFLVGEPWGGPYDPSGLSDLGIAAWNDQIRNGVKGRNPREPIPADGPGFVFGRNEDGKTSRVVRSFVTGTLREDGGLFVRAEHSLNYLESHDDNTMGDYVRMATGDVAFHSKVSDSARNAALTPRQLAIERLGALFLLTVHGPVMIAEGQEYGRSKLIVPAGVDDPLVSTLDDNSYNKDNATNYLDYAVAARNRVLCEYYRGLIALRRAYPALADAPKSAVRFIETGDDFAIAYEVDDPRFSSRLVVLLNGNTDRDVRVTLPDGSWTVLANANAAGIRPLGQVESDVLVPRTSGMVLVRTQ
jgi:pullulanase/glycogen debranching enzyme